MQNLNETRAYRLMGEDVLAKLVGTEAFPKPEVAAKPATRFQWLNWSSLFFALIQSVCTAFLALSGLRLLIGAAAFASALGVLKFADQLHRDAIRTPMMLLALVGALINLLALWQVWRLRKRPASAWRQVAVPVEKKRSERWQLALSILTLLLLAAEFFAHLKVKG
jgi:hypothetical protein